MRYNIHHKLSFKRSIILLFALCSGMFIYAQPLPENISGKVKDENGVPLEGVSITLQESTIISTTNEDGEFSISALAGDELTFILSGYETVSRRLERNELNIEVTLTAFLFGASDQDLVPVAYSNKKKRDLTSAISTTTYAEFGKRKDMNVMNCLGGLINGLVVVSSPWSDVGYDPSLYVRGLKTTNSNNAPLVLVDDVERSFSQLNVNEIASVSVLKDAAALAIYGNRGANGVVLVRTKRGKKNKRDIVINSEVGMAQSLRLPKVLNAYDYASLYNVAQVLDGVSSDNLKYSEDDLLGYKAVVDGDANANLYLYPNVDFYGEFLKSMVKQQQHDLTMTGGNNIAQYFVLLGYMNQEGLYKYGDNTFNRFNFRTNIDVALNKRLTVSLDMAGRLENLTVPGGNYAYSIFGQFASTPSGAYPIFNED